MKEKKEKKDNSPRIPQRDKIKGSLELKPFPWTERQKAFLDCALSKDTRLVFVAGPAGSTKTILAVYAALTMINEHRVSDMMYIRAAVESAKKSLGFLPGTLDEKMSVYGTPLEEKLDELTTKEGKAFLIKDKRVQTIAVNYLRGQSWNSRIAVIDEAQNLEEEELYTVLTRIGKFSKGFILADSSQCDLPKSKAGGFDKLSKWFTSPDNGCYFFQLEKTDILRDELTKYLVERYELLKQIEAGQAASGKF